MFLFRSSLRLDLWSFYWLIYGNMKQASHLQLPPVQSGLVSAVVMVVDFQVHCFKFPSSLHII